MITFGKKLPTLSSTMRDYEEAFVKMRTLDFPEFISWLKSENPLMKITDNQLESLRTRHEIENSPLAKAMREEE